MAEKDLRARKASQVAGPAATTAAVGASRAAGETTAAGDVTSAGTAATASGGWLSRLRTWVRAFAASPAAAFLVGLVVVCAVALLVWWFVMDSGIGTPAGFVYQEY